jgi:hypothetical protein
MTTVRELYAGIKDGPLTSVGLRSFDYVPGSSEWPAAFVLPPVVEYETLAQNTLELRADIVVLVSAATDKKQLDLLDYMDDQGTLSIPLAFHSDPSLGLSGVNAVIIRARPLNYEEQADYKAFGALFEASIRLS